MQLANLTDSSSTQTEQISSLRAETNDYAPINDEVVALFQLILYSAVCQAVNIFGICTNIINIICFVRQGFKESVNVSLFGMIFSIVVLQGYFQLLNNVDGVVHVGRTTQFIPGLATSDLGCLITNVWADISLVPAFQQADLSFDPMDIYYLTTAMPHQIFTRATSCITALIMLERCLCITMPLKVRNIFTPKRVAVIIGFIYVLQIVCVSPIYSVMRAGTKYDPKRNRTILGVVFTENRVLIEQISFTINNIFIPFVALAIIAICMVVIVISLKNQTKWRKSISKTTEITSDRDKKIAKMVVMVSTLFIVCFTPTGVLFIAMVLVPDFSYQGKLYNVLVVCNGFCSFLESTNSSLNIFFYYYMSSKFRTVFQQLWPKYKDESKHA